MTPVSVPVRWSDMDSYGHVNHANMVTLLDDARRRWLEGGGVAEELMETGLVVSTVNVRYRSQLRLSDAPLIATIGVADLGRVQFTTHCQLRPSCAPPDSPPSVEAITRLACFSLSRNEIAEIPCGAATFLRTQLLATPVPRTPARSRESNSPVERQP